VNSTEAIAIEHLAQRGFTDGFRIVDGGLQVLTSGKLLRPADLVIREVYRFEGVSDPDDMAVVYAIEGATGDPAKAAVLADILIRRRAEVGR